jgi:hypothetical protein|tara:strand:+ start:262 stop:759 length:498 start_codon:yes stop_codon:yes gene_type:complete
MPIYEFYSPDTHKIYSFFARSLSSTDKTPRCPDDPKALMERQVSSFAVTTGREEGDADSDDPKMEAAMAQLESEMGGIDEENPDPRQLGQLMRRMSDLTGEKLPGPMREMVERLERGEDPEKLEEQYGDILDGDGDDVFGDGAESGEGGAKERVSRWLKKRQAPE